MNLSDEEMAKFVTGTWLKQVGDVPIDEVAVMVCEDPSVVTALVGALRHARKQLDAKITGETSDGYHTFNELYDHRIGLFLALCAVVETVADGRYCWRSKLHSDGTSIDGWFIVGINSKPGDQITYHLPMSRWSDTDWIMTIERAPKFDGHTSADVLQRLKRFTP
jgi:hypothetical protein